MDRQARGITTRVVTRAKRQIVRDAVRQADGSYSEAARRLGLNRTYLHRLIRNLELRAELAKPH